MRTMDYNPINYVYKPNFTNKVSDGFEIQFAEVYILDLEIGKKYYVFDGTALKAFKVLSFSIKGDDMGYDVMYADGKIKYFSGKPNNKLTNWFIHNIYTSVDSFMHYRETNDNTNYYQLVNIQDVLEEYLNDSLRLKGSQNLCFVVPRLFILNKMARAVYYSSNIYFQSFWIDSNGLHFSSYIYGDEKLYWTINECENSFKVLDFDEEPKNEETITYDITIPKAKSMEFANAMKKIGLSL